MCKHNEIIERIKTVLAMDYRKDKSGMFYDTIYPDYNDVLRQEQLIKISQADCPEEVYNDLICEMYESAQWELESQMSTKVKNDYELHELLRSEDIDEEELNEMIAEHFYVDIPYDHFLSTEMLIDIIVDTGDGIYDFTRNSFGPHYSSNSDAIPEESSLLWLVKQQRYTLEQLRNYFNNPQKENKFLTSVYDEIANSSSYTLTLTFLAKMSLKEYFEMRDFMEQNPDGQLTLSKDVECGLYDPWEGAGGLLEIRLDHDVELPIKFIDSTYQDGGRGYSIQKIYDVSSVIWRKNIVKNILPQAKCA